MSSFQNTILEYKNEVSGTLNIGISKSLAKQNFTQTLKKFMLNHSKIDIKIKLGKTEEQKSLLKKRKIDLGISINHGDLAEFQTKTLSKGTFNFIGKKKCESNLLTTEPRPETIKLLSHLRKKQSSYFKYNHLEIESWSVILQMIQSGLGYGLIPDFLVPKNKSLIDIGNQIELPKLPYEIVFFHSGDQSIDFPLKKFIPYLLQSFNL